MSPSLADTDPTAHHGNLKRSEEEKNRDAEPISKATECISSVSQALQARNDGGELYDTVDDNLLRLVAEFVSYRKFSRQAM